MSRPPDTNYYNYTVNLRVASVEGDVVCYNSVGHPYNFKDINAFNKYFHHLLPRDNGSSLPDVWVGYYHITLGKFRLNPRHGLDAREKVFLNYIKTNSSPEQHYANVFPCKFRTTNLNVHSGANRHAEAKDIDFVTLKIHSLDDALEKLNPLLELIKQGVRVADGKWESKAFQEYWNELHVTVRKYKDSHSKWTSEFIQTCGIIEQVQQNPLEFECIALDVVQIRRQARERGSTDWWIGVTGIPLECIHCHRNFPQNSPGYCPRCHQSGYDHQCSECGQQGNDWSGYCEGCRDYERVKPLWSTEL